MLQENMDWWEATKLSDSYSCRQATPKQPEFWLLNCCKDTYLTLKEKSRAGKLDFQVPQIFTSSCSLCSFPK